ncbi:MAG: PD-(D/E)XK nuclease family protein [Anaerolineae bacterium]|nr:PD-(D/E)XK nuclease family protein [Anaerolineae bacterium]
MLNVGQNLLLNNRRWHIRRIQLLAGRVVELEVIGASDAAQGMTRTLTAIRYEDDLFIEHSPARGDPRYWHGHLQQDWVEDTFGLSLQCRPAQPLDLLAVHSRHPTWADLPNDFSWSFSRAGRYRRCPRSYFYHYYAAWDGWREAAPAPIRRAYLLKNLTSLPLWTGTLVHESIRFALARLKAGHPVADGDLLRQMRTRAKADFTTSQSGDYQQQPNQLTGFQEHYYRVSPADKLWRTAWQQAERYLNTFLNSPLYARLRQLPATAFLDVETLQSFFIGDTKVWVQLDLACREGDRVTIYDWKTGGSLDELDLRRQLGLYGLYLRQAFPEVAAGRLEGVVYALAEDRLLEFELDQTVLGEAQTYAEASIAELRGLCLSPSANLADMGRFPMIDDLAVCRRCNFRELCGRD